jgi:pyruvate formate lyase activating enzyme
MREASYYEKEGDRLRCRLCPHTCLLAEREIGLCLTRRHSRGYLMARSYGAVTSIALDPLEKKPLHHFRPGEFILSVGSFGCNMRCYYCQNHSISREEAPFQIVSPEELVDRALSFANNVGVAFTYNEPLLSFEYILDTAPLLRRANLQTVLVTNGFLNPEAFAELLPLTDALNIDVKSFEPATYRRLGGDLDIVKRNVEQAVATSHVEVTCLIVPGSNDSTEEMNALTTWLASLSPDIPLHLSRCFPRHEYTGEPTPQPVLKKLEAVAKKHLRHVYLGNI